MTDDSSRGPTESAKYGRGDGEFVKDDLEAYITNSPESRVKPGVVLSNAFRCGEV